MSANELRQIAPSLWCTSRPQRVGGVLDLGHRMTVVRDDDGGLVVHSPVRLDDGIEAELRELGAPRVVIAPSLMHNLHLDEFRARFPDVPLVAAPAFAESNPMLVVDGELLREPWTDLGAGLTAHLVEGMPKLNEVVFVHAPSRSAIVADVVFNLGRERDLITRVALRLLGAYGHVARSRLLRSMIVDETAALASIDRILAQDFDRLVVGHGEIVETGGRNALAAAWGRSSPSA